MRGLKRGNRERRQEAMFILSRSFTAVALFKDPSSHHDLKESDPDMIRGRIERKQTSAWMHVGGGRTDGQRGFQRLFSR